MGGGHEVIFINVFLYQKSISYNNLECNNHQDKDGYRMGDVLLYFIVNKFTYSLGYLKILIFLVGV